MPKIEIIVQGIIVASILQYYTNVNIQCTILYDSITMVYHNLEHIIYTLSSKFC